MATTWVGAGLLIASAVFTVFRLVRSWRSARTKVDAIDPLSGSA